MNTTKLNVHKKVLQEVCENFGGAEGFIKDKIEYICSNEKLSLEEVNLFYLWKIATTFKAKLVMIVKNLIECNATTLSFLQQQAGLSHKCLLKKQQV